ncbi:helix-turn-helix transcriptional regulator [Nocardioides sp. 503]|uniref:helix-turn-helix transcriptional regulator n=1 Tax=Nocardioides sp. 503 TaxID=2508326 RepID=UPI001070671D|nr:helix-turn-helix transcriptional regulator [Nocardioides sp. 503]
MTAPGRERSLARLLDAVVDGSVSGWTCELVAGDDPAWDASLRVLALVLLGRWDHASELAHSLPPVDPDDGDAWWLRLAVTAWAVSGDPRPGSDSVLVALDGTLLGSVPGARLPDPTTALGRFGASVLAEALLAHARLDLARALVDRLGPPLWEPLVLEGRLHAFGSVVAACRVRLLAFRGDIDAAGAAHREAPAASPGPVAALQAATGCLVRGNDAQPSDVRRLVGEVDRWAPEPADLLGRGAQMLVAFGLIAVGDVAESARRVLAAGGDPDLSALNVIDRALGLELLVALAVAEEDLDAAQAWAARALPLLASPIADSTVSRLLSRVALLDDRVEEAVAWAERAVARARAADRMIEYAEGEIVLSRARLRRTGGAGSAAAVRALERMVAEAERTGHRAARRSAARELRPIGRRLRPTSGSAWAGLTAREADVARLVAEGASNREVATRLHLSEHTVRVHVSRVLAAFGVATRSALPGAIGAAPTAAAYPSLTPRQREVAALVARGLSNREIADGLGLSPRTVERHVADVLTRWDLTGRTAIARVVGAPPP